jgi:ElaB/YqjD/DUF883 family membrane-anchored ribosome-binding protein
MRPFPVRQNFRLSRRVSDHLSAGGRKPLRDANQRLDDTVRERPFAAVAIAAALGLLCGVMFWRR